MTVVDQHHSNAEGRSKTEATCPAYGHRALLSGWAGLGEGQEEEGTVMQQDSIPRRDRAGRGLLARARTSSSTLLNGLGRSLNGGFINTDRSRAGGGPTGRRRVVMGTRALGSNNNDNNNNEGRLVCLCLAAWETAGDELEVEGGPAGARVERAPAGSRLRSGDTILAVNGSSLAGVGAERAAGLLVTGGLSNLIVARGPGGLWKYARHSPEYTGGESILI
jgi:hypothetical protein